MKRILIAGVLVALSSGLAVAKDNTQHARILKVWAGNMRDWAFTSDDIGIQCGPDEGCELTVDRPGDLTTAPLGQGSARFTLGLATPARQLLFSMPLQKTLRLERLATLKYSTFVQWSFATFGSTPVPALVLTVDLHGKGKKGDQGRLVFSPGLNVDVEGQPVRTGAWQTWDAIREGLAQWYFDALPPGHSTNPCSQVSACTLDEIRQMFPKATIRKKSGRIAFEVGRADEQFFEGNVDALTIGIAKSKPGAQSDDEDDDRCDKYADKYQDKLEKYGEDRAAHYLEKLEACEARYGDTDDDGSQDDAAEFADKLERCEAKYGDERCAKYAGRLDKYASDKNGHERKDKVKQYVTIYNFEGGGPTSKQECKSSGWLGFFPNQGQCVAFFAANRQ